MKVRQQLVTSLDTVPVAGKKEYLKQGDRYLLYVTGSDGTRHAPGVVAHAHDVATQSVAGFMSAGDKLKLDSYVLFGTSHRGTTSLATGDLNGYLKTGAYHTFGAVLNQPSSVGHYLWRLNHDTVDGGGFLDIISPASIANTKLYWRKGDATSQLAYEALANESWVTANFVSASALTGYVPTTRSVSAGAGLTGGGALSSNVTLALSTTGVTAGTYTSVTVDAYGRVTGGSNPSSGSVAWSAITGKPTTLYDFGVLTDADSRYLKLIGGTMTGNIVVTPTTGGSSTSLRNFLSYVPSDYGVGAPALNFTKLANATRYQFSIYDGSSNAGRLNFSMSELTWNDALLVTQTGLTSALASYATQSWVTSQGYVSSSALSSYTPTSRSVSGSMSVNGGGDLTANRFLSLVNDSATPGNSKYYGTNGSGTKGWFDLPGAVDLSSYVQNTRSISTSGSLTGGGNLTANRTLSLVNDSATPGNNYVYATNAVGTKGWHSLTNLPHSHNMLDVDGLSTQLSSKVDKSTTITINDSTLSLNASSLSFTVEALGVLQSSLDLRSTAAGPQTPSIHPSREEFLKILTNKNGHIINLPNSGTNGKELTVWNMNDLYSLNLTRVRGYTNWELVGGAVVRLFYHGGYWTITSYVDNNYTSNQPLL